MQSMLLETKLYKPRKMAHFMERSRLVDKLNTAEGKKLTLISAPAGFGKTALLSEWTHQVDCRVAWVSLDASDNEIIRFVSYILHALNRIDDGLAMKAASLLKSADPPVDAILDTLINELSGYDGRLIIALDDYHLITSQEIHNIVTFFIDNLPANTQIAIAGRIDPPLPLARLRVQGLMNEIRAADLRFNSDESVLFLNDLMKLDLSPDDVTVLEKQTEGWIAGLHLAALSLQHRQDKHAFVTSFSGSHRHVFDYLVDEALADQPQEIQEFLLSTSVLDRFCAKLCDHILGTGDSQKRLEYLEKNNLFLISLDDQRHWWRYHHLFGDFLQQRLQHSNKDMIKELHVRAADWLRNEGFASEAAEHALAAGDFDLAASILHPLLENLLAESKLSAILTWKEKLPDETISHYPWLCVCFAWTCLLAARIEDLHILLAWAEEAIEGQEYPDDPLMQEVPHHISAVRSFFVRFQGDHEKSIEMAMEPYEWGRKHNPRVHSAAALNLGVSNFSLGRLEDAEKYLRETIDSGIESNMYYSVLTAYGCLGASQREMGKLRMAYQTCNEGIQFGCDQGGGRPLPATGYAYLFMAEILYDWNRLDEAESYLTQAIDLSIQAKELGVRLDAHLVLAKIQKVRGDFDGALGSLKIAEESAAKLRKSPLGNASLDDFKAEMALARDDLDTALNLANKSMSDGREISDPREIRSYFTQAKILSACNKPSEAIELLEAILAVPQVSSRLGHVVRSLAMLAAAYSNIGDNDKSYEALTRALSLAEREDYIRVFLDQGPVMAKLLKKITDDEPGSKFAKRLLKEFRVTSRQRPVTQTGRSSEQDLIDPLSDRELEVLGLLAKGMKYQEIADKLVVSLNTIRAHTKNIYSKLAVNSAGQAVKKALDKKLIDL